MCWIPIRPGPRAINTHVYICHSVSSFKSAFGSPRQLQFDAIIYMWFGRIAAACQGSIRPGAGICKFCWQNKQNNKLQKLWHAHPPGFG